MSDATQWPNEAEIHALEIERDWLDGAKAINELFDHAEGSRQRWLRIGRGLLAGRRKCPADREFNEFLDQTTYRAISRDERAGAMWLCVNAAIVLPALKETRIANPEWARRHIRVNLPSIYAQCDEVRWSVSEVFETDTVPVPVPEQKLQPIAPQEPEKTETPVATAAEIAPPLERKAFRATGRPSPIKDLPKADLINAYVLATHTRTGFGRLARKPNGRAAWGLLIESIETGLFGPPSKFDTDHPNVRALLPWLPPRSFDGLLLKDSSVQKTVREVLFPMLRERPELLETPYLIEREFELRRRAIDEEARRKSKLDEHRAKIEAGAVAAGEHPIIAFGEPLWPPQRSDLTLPYSYKELCHACWFFNYFLGIARSDWKPIDTAMAGRHLAKYIEPVQPGFVAAVRAIFNAYEDHPNGEKQFPPTPVNFGN